MKLQSRSREEPEINVISLVDVLLVLVLFFMVSTTFLRESHLTLHLPEASESAPSQASSVKLEITVTRTGSYLVNGRELVNSDRRTLKAAIEKMAGQQRDMPVYVRADGQATHQSVITALDVAGQLGFTNVNIAVVNSPKG